MCLNPITISGTLNVFACRSCNECVETRVNEWAVRALAEAQVAGHTYAITFTYADLPTGRPVGATVFKYRDIQLMLKLLRTNYSRHYGGVGEIRYIACGEQGSKGTKRVHWHVILYSDRDIRPAIEWVDFETKKPVAPSDVLTDKNYNTDIWPHGHCLMQKPDARGIRYALKYALKNQFGIAKSEGTNRLPDAEVWAASFFRMSKKPPIGMRYLERLVSDAAANKQVYPSLRVHVPKSDGFWYLNNRFAQYWVSAMAEINRQIRAETGRDAAAWSSLLTAIEESERMSGNAELSELARYGSEKDRGPSADARRVVGGAWLVAGTPEADAERRATLESYLAARKGAGSASAVRRNDADTVGRCGGFAPCAACARGLGPEARDAAEAAHRKTRAAWFDADAARNEEIFGDSDSLEWRREFERRWRRGSGGPSQWCALRETREVVDAFDWASHQRLARSRAEGRKPAGYKGKGAVTSGGRAARYGDRA